MQDIKTICTIYPFYIHYIYEYSINNIIDKQHLYITENDFNNKTILCNSIKNTYLANEKTKNIIHEPIYMLSYKNDIKHLLQLYDDCYWYNKKSKEVLSFNVNDNNKRIKLTIKIGTSCSLKKYFDYTPKFEHRFNYPLTRLKYIERGKYLVFCYLIEKTEDEGIIICNFQYNSFSNYVYEDIIHFIENTTKLNIQSKSKKWINNSCLNMSFDYDAKDYEVHIGDKNNGLMLDDTDFNDCIIKNNYLQTNIYILNGYKACIKGSQITKSIFFIGDIHNFHDIFFNNDEENIAENNTICSCISNNVSILPKIIFSY